MANISLSEGLESIDYSLLVAHNAERDAAGDHMAKVALAALILDPYNDVLVCPHEAREGQFPSGALGVPMETYRYLDGDGPITLETPLQTFQRCLYEELGFDEDMFNSAGFHFDRKHPVKQFEWSIGPNGPYKNYFGWTTSVIVRVDSIKPFERTSRVGEEILSMGFHPLHEVLASTAPRRPGFDAWLTSTYRAATLPFAHTSPQYLKWQYLPKTAEDVLHPYLREAA